MAPSFLKGLSPYLLPCSFWEGPELGGAAMGMDSSLGGLLLVPLPRKQTDRDSERAAAIATRGAENPLGS